jgi:hypothetical protein
MANKVLLKKSSVPAKIPVPSDLDYGELAINYADGKLYFKNSNNQVQAFSQGDGGGSSGSPYLDAGFITEAVNMDALLDGGTIA